MKTPIIVVAGIAVVIGILMWMIYFTSYQGQCWNWADQQFTSELNQPQQPISDLDYYNICMKYNGMPGTTHDDLMSAPKIKVPPTVNQTGS